MAGNGSETKNGGANPGSPPSLREAIARHRAGALDEAEQAYRAILADAPQSFDALHLLGVVQLQRGRPAEARPLLESASALDPRSADARCHLGNALGALGQNAQAVASYDAALAIKHDHVNALANRALALVRIGRFADALASSDAALALAPDLAEAWSNRAIALHHLGESDKALASCDRALALRPAFPEALANRAAILNDLRRAVEALASSSRAVELNPNYAEGHFNRGAALQALQRHDEALPAFERALALEPGLAQGHGSSFVRGTVLAARMHCCDWRGYGEELAALIADVRAGAASALPLPFLALATSAEDELRCAQIWVREKFPSAAHAAAPPSVAYAAGERLRVAFVTWNLRDHPTMHLSLEFWEKIDRSRLEMFLYGLRPDDDNPFQRRARAAFEHFADVSALPVGEIAQRIRDDRIGILIDRNGYTLNAREGIFALKPAPIQVNCIGFPGTLGAPWYDYIFTDRFSLPESLARFYSERPLYMPQMAFPSDTTRLPPGPAPGRASLGLPVHGLVFCCFNNAYKILPEVFAIWMRLLRAVPRSVLWLLETSAAAKTNLAREAQAAGVEPGRLLFAPRVGVSAHVARQVAADLFLDTYPYGAHTTANDALLAGLPLVTCVGETLASRIAGSQLHAIGLPELVTESLEAYEALALKLATEPGLLRSYRARLAANRSTYPLFDMALYARDFEHAMLRVWAEHRADAAA